MSPTPRHAQPRSVPNAHLSADFTGPSFLLEPPGKHEYSNTTGAWIDCTAAGHPAPRVQWLTADGTPVQDVPGLRLDMANGTLALPPFPPAMYRQDVHSAVYRCLATNDVGAIISRDVHARAGELPFGGGGGQKPRVEIPPPHHPLSAAVTNRVEQWFSIF